VISIEADQVAWFARNSGRVPFAVDHGFVLAFLPSSPPFPSLLHRLVIRFSVGPWTPATCNTAVYTVKIADQGDDAPATARVTRHRPVTRRRRALSVCTFAALQARGSTRSDPSGAEQRQRNRWAANQSVSQSVSQLVSQSVSQSDSQTVSQTVSQSVS